MEPLTPNLHTFHSPPTTEILLGVQFEPLKNLRALHYGIFWQNYLDSFDLKPSADAPILEHYAESFNSPQLRKNQIAQREELAGVRLQFRSEDRSRLLQFQADKLYFSWHKTKDEDQIPSFESLKTEFRAVYLKLEEFANDSRFESLSPNLWEVKYINQIPVGNLWQEPSDWYRILPKFFQPITITENNLRFTTFEGEWYHEIQPELGRVRVRVAKMLVNQKPPPVLYLRLLARGEIGETKTLDWEEGLDLGHNSCVEIFDKITSEEAKKEWGTSHD